MEDPFELNYLCDECDNSSKVYCAQCECGFCVKHDQMRHSKAMTNHERYKVEKSSDFHVLLCKKHTTTVNTIYCMDCKSLVCQKCQRTEHFDHECVGLSEGIKSLKEIQQKQMDHLKPYLEEYGKFEKNAKIILSGIEQNRVNESSEILKQFKKLEDFLEQQKNKILQQIDNKYTQKLISVQQQKGNYYSTHQKLKKFNKGMQNFEESFNEEKMYRSDYLLISNGLQNNEIYNSLQDIPIPKPLQPSNKLFQFNIDEQMESLQKLSFSSIFDLTKTKIIIPERVVKLIPFQLRCIFKNKNDEIIDKNLPIDLQVWAESNAKEKFYIKMEYDPKKGNFLGTGTIPSIGNYDVYATIDQRHINEEQAPIGKLIVTEAYDLRKCEVKYDTMVLRNTRSYICITLKDSDSNIINLTNHPKIEIVMKYPSKETDTIKCKKVKNQVGVYGTAIKFQLSGSHTFKLFIEGIEIPDSPYNFKVGHHTTGFTLGDSLTSGKPQLKISEDEMMVMNNRSSSNNGRFVFSRKVLTYPTRYRFVIKIEKTTGKNMFFGVGTFTNSQKNAMKDTWGWNCGKALKIRNGAEEAYGEIAKTNDTVIIEGKEKPEKNENEKGNEKGKEKEKRKRKRKGNEKGKEKEKEKEKEMEMRNEKEKEKEKRKREGKTKKKGTKKKV
ncbi:hypothetical protein M0813_20845 [Anaeramoeba flamelloides]|uniref:B box-type domain-containing protein n=1 Tax=Anaeramoeba flamelloides TaxID=1746091 RepID=A0ABQ8YJU6_9EUKA|nr:hypothetical protein M0813_20845 [Anaeramoeba flamelloides]